MIRKAFLCLLLGAVALGCQSDGSGRGGRQPTEVELRSMQTRTYETDKTDIVMKAMLNTLQDLGYVVENVDKDLGYLMAVKEVSVYHKKREVKKAQEKGIPLANTQVFKCTANVSPFEGKVRVRVSFQHTILDGNGNTMEANVVSNPAFYQQFHSKVSKGVFLQVEGV